MNPHKSIEAAEWNYKEHDRWLKVQFIDDISDEEILKELTVLRNMSEINSEQVLMWSQRKKVQRVQKKAFHKMKNMTGFGHIHSAKGTEIDNEQQPKRTV